jgi:hypothetical protein
LPTCERCGELDEELTRSEKTDEMCCGSCIDEDEAESDEEEEE